MTSSVTVGVLALQGDVREHLNALRATGVDAIAVRGAADLHRVAGLVIPGGESTTMSILAVREGLMQPLREFVDSGHPCFGSCAGLIFLADRVVGGRADQQTIGGLDVTAQRNSFGRQVDSFETDLAIPVLGEQPFPAVFIRAPSITQAGAEVEILASIGDRIVAVRQGALLATAFHPELTDDHRLHRYFVGMVVAHDEQTGTGAPVDVHGDESIVRKRA